MMRIPRLVVLFLALAACVKVTPPPAAQPQLPRASRVVLYSFDGLSADQVERRSAAGTFSEAGFGGMLATGLSARVVPVNPTVTATTHLSMATGADPQKTGIVLNTIHLPGDPPAKKTSGFSTPIDVETIWEAARRQGKTVGVLTFPGLDWQSTRRKADWGMNYPGPTRGASVVTLKRADFHPDWYPPGWTPADSRGSFSPILRTALKWTFSTTGGGTVSRDVVLAAIDTTDDRVADYDRIDVLVDGQRLAVDADGWFSLSTTLQRADGTHLYGSWSKVLRSKPDLSEVEVYWGAVYALEAYPESYRSMIDSALGFWPGPPDGDNADDWFSSRRGLDPVSFSQQVRRFERYMTAATTLSMQKMPWDLILGYQMIIDETEHRYLLVDDRQMDYTPENAAQAARAIDATYQQFDRSVGELRAALPPGSLLCITGDHGMAAGDTFVGVNQILVDAGLARRDGGAMAADSHWSVYTSGNVAVFYQFAGDAAERQKLVKLLRDLKTADGSPVFEQVQEKSAADHPRRADVVATAYPRFYADNSATAVLGPTNHYGLHGALNTHTELNTWFTAAGSGTTRGSLGTIPQTAIARIVSTMLGIDPPSSAQ